MRTRLATLALTLPLGLAALTGCAGDDSSEEAAPAGSTSSASDDAGDAEEADDGDDPGAEEVDRTEGEEISAEDFTALMVAAFDKATTADVTMQMTAGGQEIESVGQADYSTSPPSMRMEMSGIGGMGEMTMIMVDNVIYMKVAQMSEKFIKLDLDDPANPMGDSFTGQLDPRAQAEVIEAGLVTATYVGEEDVDGDDLDRYTAVVDSQAMFEQMELDPAAAGALPEEITYDLWFDDEGRFAQMAVDMGATAGEVLIRFENWGTDVEIEAPKPSEVTDMGAVTGAS
jgi:hypothetical protein